MRRLFVLLALGLLAAAQERPLPDTEELEREVKRLIGVYAIVEEQSADPVSPDAAIYGGAIPGMLRKLDPHSVFFDKEQFAQLQEMQNSMTKGFGSIVSVLPGRVIVLETQAGSPSQRSGLAPGDEIIAINNIPLSSLDIDQLVQLLSMTRQKPASLYVRRQGAAKLLSLTLTPAEMQSPSVDRAFLLEPRVAFIRVSSFDGPTAQEFKAAVEKLGGAGLKGLVLDLRGNGGGVLASALEMASQFLQPGQLILSARGRSAVGREVKTPDNVQPYRFPVAVLVNEKTASAAEIVTGAWQDHKRARVFGVRTYGKGLVQSVYPLKDETGLALTTAFYYTPNGRSIQRPLKDVELSQATSGNTAGGIEPDEIVTPEAPSRLRAVLEMNASFAEFANEWLAKNRERVRPDMEIDPAMLSDFQLWLSRRNVRPGIGEWTSEGAFVRRRLKQEILNLSLGVQAGDEVELRADPVVRRALSYLQQP